MGRGVGRDGPALDRLHLIRHRYAGVGARPTADDDRTAALLTARRDDTAGLLSRRVLPRLPPSFPAFARPAAAGRA
ncbi:hypothetical protein ACWEQU_28025, partial [Streptomyces nodosus]